MLQFYDTKLIFVFLLYHRLYTFTATCISATLLTLTAANCSAATNKPVWDSQYLYWVANYLMFEMLSIGSHVISLLPLLYHWLYTYTVTCISFTLTLTGANCLAATNRFINQFEILISICIRSRIISCLRCSVLGHSHMLSYNSWL